MQLPARAYQGNPREVWVGRTIYTDSNVDGSMPRKYRAAGDACRGMHQTKGSADS
ncbi:MAG: hypothetical protein ACYTDV_16240 [Planctomycetota bacterium]